MNVQDSLNYLKQKGIESIDAAIVMGTGLGKLTEHIQNPICIDYGDIPHFSPATMEFHKGMLWVGELNGVKVAAMQGRYHYYEGYSMQQITYPIRILKGLGAKMLVLSNAAGGIKSDFKKGDIVLIEDHINLLPDNPLRGQKDPELGPIFVDMIEPYNQKLNQAFTALVKSTQLKTGVYASVCGPNLETRAEYRFLRTIGADMVGMSTVPEVIVANQIELPCMALSVITDECQPEKLQPINIPEIMEVAGKTDEVLSEILSKNFKQLYNSIV